MGKAIIIVALASIVLVSAFIFISNKQVNPKVSKQKEVTQEPTSTQIQNQAVDNIASFAIFTDGTFRVFTAAMYHNLSPDAYIEASGPNIIKIRKADVTWSDFFSTLPFKLTHDCLVTGTKETFCSNKNKALKFYLNGERKAQILDEVIRDKDELLITYGNESEEAIELQIQEVPNL